MTADDLVNIRKWTAILYATPAHGAGASRRWDAYILRRMRKDIGRC